MVGPRIVVGVDGSPGAEHALRWAVRMAERTGGSIRAVKAWEFPALSLLPAPLGMPVPPPERMTEATAGALAEEVAPVRASTDVAIDEVVRQGGGAVALLREADSADLVVVGTRGRGRLASVLLGSVSRRVAAAAPCAVAVVPEAADLDREGPVVVGVDGSLASLAALRWAGEATEGAIHAVHVDEYPFGPEYAIEGFEWGDPHALGQELLDRAVAETLGDRPGVTTAVADGDAREVLAEATADAALLVVGARGAGGIEGALLGSVTQALASAVTVPVVIVPGG